MPGVEQVGFRLDEVVPWGRSFDEYVAMFALTEEDLQRRILGCGDGPASFNRGVTERGGDVVSVDAIKGTGSPSGRSGTSFSGEGTRCWWWRGGKGA